MMKIKTDKTFLIRSLIFSALFAALGLGMAHFLNIRYGYSRIALFAGICGVIIIGIAMNIYIYATTNFYEEGDALVIENGFSKKKTVLNYTLIRSCALKCGSVDKLFKTKTLAIHYPDYKGIVFEKALGLKADYADKLATHIAKRMRGEDSEFPLNTSNNN
ncbi:MAG: hypothetical protein EOM87_03880 [Clostridia bacterium]|nr:hypothetical protein [Clostridia bacterium]